MILSQPTESQALELPTRVVVTDLEPLHKMGVRSAMFQDSKGKILFVHQGCTEAEHAESLRRLEARAAELPFEPAAQVTR